MDRLEEWRIFSAVAGAKSFAKAAQLLGRSPQAVTRGIAALEDRVGARLLNRTTRSVSLTSDGERLLRSASRMLEEVEALEVEALSLGGGGGLGARTRGGKANVANVANAPLRGVVSIT